MLATCSFGNTTTVDENHEREALWASVYTEAQEQALRPSHRLSIRPWTAPHYERIPSVARVKRMAQAKQRQQQDVQAWSQFVHHVRGIHGSEMRAWRRDIAVDGAFCVKTLTFRAVCRRMDFPGDVDAVLRWVDPGKEGKVALSTILPKGALLLVGLRDWLQEIYGSCNMLWETEPSFDRHRGVTWNAFATLLRRLDCPVLTKKEVKDEDPEVEGSQEDESRSINLAEERLWFILHALDFHGAGIILPPDIDWLDQLDKEGRFPGEADPEAWEEIQTESRRKYRHPLIAWRMAFDLDSSNCVTFQEFKDACEYFNSTRNVGGAWRVLDKDFRGVIHLHDIDPASADIVESFKDWALSTFGSIRQAFVQMDRDGGGTLSCEEMRRACRRLKWDGDPRLFFEAVALDGSHVSYQDLTFLSTWSCRDPEADAEVLEVRERLWQELFLPCQSQQLTNIVRKRVRSAGLEGRRQRWQQRHFERRLQLQTEEQEHGLQRDLQQSQQPPWVGPLEQDYSTTAAGRRAAATTEQVVAGESSEVWDNTDPNLNDTALDDGVSAPTDAHASKPVSRSALHKTILRTWRGSCWAPFTPLDGSTAKELAAEAEARKALRNQALDEAIFNLIKRVEAKSVSNQHEANDTEVTEQAKKKKAEQLQQAASKPQRQTHAGPTGAALREGHCKSKTAATKARRLLLLEGQCSPYELWVGPAEGLFRGKPEFADRGVRNPFVPSSTACKTRAVPNRPRPP